MSLPVVEQTWTLFLGGKTPWRRWEGSCQAHLILGWFIYTALLTHHFHFLLCPPPNPSHTSTNVHLSLQPYLPFPTQHHGWLSLSTGSNPARGCEADRRDKPLSTLLSWLHYCKIPASSFRSHTYIPISAHIPPPQNCTGPTGRAGRWLTAALLPQTARCKSSCGQTQDERVTPQPGPRREECIPLPHPRCTGPTEGPAPHALNRADFTNINSLTRTTLFYQVGKTFLAVSSASQRRCPLPSIFSSLANSPNVGKTICQNDRDFASTVQLPHVIVPPEAGKQFSHIPLTSGQKSWLEWIRETAWFCDAVNHSACPSCRNPPAPSSKQTFHS